MEPTNELVYHIVDDEAQRQERAVSALLRAHGKRVWIFTSGQDFLDFARRDSCACLILDLKMPGLGGSRGAEADFGKDFNSCDLLSPGEETSHQP